jgi:dihydroxy-acid dehydratase
MALFRQGITARQVLSADAFHNAFTCDMAMGGSTNSVLHLLAIAHEAHVSIDLHDLNDFNSRTPHLCKLAPASTQHIEDLYYSGGISAILHELQGAGLLKTDAVTATGGTLAANLAPGSPWAPDYCVVNRDVVHSVAAPYSANGGLTILFGNLAPEGAVVKSAAVAPRMQQHRGPARCFRFRGTATEAIMAATLKRATCWSPLRRPRGGPGMREMLTPTSLLSGMGVDDKVALITDGRFSGASRGAAIGHVSPEAAARGPMAAVRDGDTIEIDIPARRLTLDVPEDEMARRLAALPAFEPKIKTGYLKRYARLVTSASTGAVFED